jgi:hypothetical protein
VVKPACSVFIAKPAPSIAWSALVLRNSSSLVSGPCSLVRCTWLSISPGSTNASRRFTTVAPRGLE